MQHPSHGEGGLGQRRRRFGHRVGLPRFLSREPVIRSFREQPDELPQGAVATLQQRDSPAGDRRNRHFGPPRNSLRHARSVPSRPRALTGLLGTGTVGSVHALAVYENPFFPGFEHLYVGGSFSSSGGGFGGPFIARWNGSEWSGLGPPGGGLDGPVHALQVFRDGEGFLTHLYAGGGFTTAGGTTVNRIAQWDGFLWSELGIPGTGMGTSYLTSSTAVFSLATYDDGAGPALFVGGHFGTAGGLASRYIASWVCTEEIFRDGFESGDLSAWSGVRAMP
jgi:hypothetical protein